MSKKGFTLIELLVYIAIFAVVAGLLTGILATFVRIQSRETASAAVSQELSFVQTTIQRLVRESVNIENPPGVASSTLILRMASSTLDPTIISSDANAIYLKQGSGAASTLTSARVKVSQFQAVKYENPGGHAIAQIDLSLTYNSQKIYQQITQNLKTSIGRVTAATFDDNLIPNADNAFSIGIASTNRWKDLNISNLLNLGQLADNPVTGSQNGSIYYNTTNNVFRGYKAGAWANLGEGFWAASSTAIYNTNSGNVGIGTTNPGQKLTVAGTIETTSGGVKFPDGTIQTTTAVGSQAQQVTGNNSVSNSSTSWVDMPDMSITLTTTGGPVLLMFNGIFYGTGNPEYMLQFYESPGGNSYGFYRFIRASYHEPNWYWNVNGTWLSTGLSAGTHTFKVRWKTNVGTVIQDGGPRHFIAAELK